MREQEYRARDKVVHKMTRDGLAERNLSENTEQRISQRQADFSFRQAQAGGTAGSRENSGVQRDGKTSARYGNQAREWGNQATIRGHGAGDAGHTAAVEAQPAALLKGDGAGQENSLGNPSEEIAGSGRTGGNRRRPGQQISRTGRKPESGSSDGDAQRAEAGRQSGSRRRPADRGQVVHDRNAQRKKQLQRDNAEIWREQKTTSYCSDSSKGDTGREGGQADTDFRRQENGSSAENSSRFAGDTGYSNGGEGRFGGEADHSDGDKSRFNRNAGHSDGHKARFSQDASQSAGNAGHASESTDRRRKSAGSGESAAYGSEPDSEGSRADAASRKYQKVEKRLESAERKLERAKEKLPTCRRLKLEATEDNSTGRKKSRLRFETEVIPENQEPSLLKRTGGRAVHTAQLAASAAIHQKVGEAGRDNVGVEAAHKVEIVGERAAGRAYRTARKRLRSRPYRVVRRAEKEAISAGRDAAYRKFLMENPEAQKKALAKWVQKQKIKRKYAAAARKAAKGAGRTAGAASTGKAAMSAAGYLGKSKAVLVAVAAAILVFILSGSLFTSCSSMFMGMGSAVTAACYLAEDTEINQSELRYTELETDLQLDIAHTESNYPGYDEYRYNIGEIGHNPYELMGYLSAVFNDFTYTQVEAELYRLFGLQYELTRESVTEVRTYLDEEGEEQEYDWHILKTALTVRPLSGILSAGLAPGDQAERYGIYMLTCGGRQNFGSPFDFPWLGYVTSPYGYRVHPLSGDKDLHRGIDIAAAEGTPILAVQDGHVVSVGDVRGYGLCLVVEGEDGYQSRYAHCSSITVSAGQEVRRGDVVAYVGNTGDSTGPHLHLEAVHNGEYLNPYFFVENGGGGYTAAGNAAGRPQFPADPGEPMGDGTFGAMLEVAERYIGYPYVWGGSSPETSFDCSGYVSYVINQSGAGSVGRQTAQGLCNLCTSVSWEDLQPGDLVFFTGTYSSVNPVSHVGIYVGGGRMVHAGDPVGYAVIGNSRYWREHFYCGGRLP